MENNRDIKDLIIAFLAGGLAGGAMAYLLQSEEGKKLAEEFKSSAEEKIEKGKEIIEESEEEIIQKLKNALEILETKHQKKLSKNGK